MDAPRTGHGERRAHRQGLQSPHSSVASRRLGERRRLHLRPRRSPDTATGEGLWPEQTRWQGSRASASPEAKLTTTVTTTQTIIRHQQHPAKPGRGADRRPESRVGRSGESKDSSPDQLRRAPSCHCVTAVVTATSSTVLLSDTIRRTPHGHVARCDPGSACICNRRANTPLS
jgi:hypothetical protein